MIASFTASRFLILQFRSHFDSQESSWVSTTLCEKDVSLYISAVFTRKFEKKHLIARKFIELKISWGGLKDFENVLKCAPCMFELLQEGLCKFTSGKYFSCTVRTKNQNFDGSTFLYQLPMNSFFPENVVYCIGHISSGCRYLFIEKSGHMSHHLITRIIALRRNGEFLISSNLEPWISAPVD